MPTENINTIVVFYYNDFSDAYKWDKERHNLETILLDEKRIIILFNTKKT